MSDWVNYVGEISQSQKPDKNGNPCYYIKFKKDFEGLRGNTILLQKYSDYLKSKVERGWITEEQRQEKLEKVTWVKYVLNVPPQDKTEPDNYKSKSGWINNALELTRNEEGTQKLRIAHNFSVKQDQTITLVKLEDDVKKQLELGFITQEVADKRLGAAEWLKYVASIPPAK